MGFQEISVGCPREDIGSAHGRFQPLHNEHLEYLLAAKRHCHFLWIGVTQYDIKNLSKKTKEIHRERPFNNPLTYFERVEMITNALINEGIPINEFGIIPFPIEHPQLLNDFLPTNIPIFTTICENWNKHKNELLKNNGYRVIVLWERPKQVEGLAIRLSIAKGSNTWIEEVPSATKRIIEKYGIKSRLASLLYLNKSGS